MSMDGSDLAALSPNFFETWFRARASAISGAVRHAIQSTRFYSDRLGGISLSRDLDWPDFQAIPVTSNEDVISQPLDFLIVPLQQIRAIGVSSGRSPKMILTADPVNAATYRTSEESLGLEVGDHLATILYTANIGQTQLPKVLDRKGIRSTVIASDAVRIHPKSTLRFLADSRITVLRSTPDMILMLTAMAEELDFDLARMAVKFITVTGSPITENIRRFVESRWNTRVYAIWGANEIGEMGVECEQQAGYHINEDAFFIEADMLDLTASRPRAIGEAIVSKLRPGSTCLLRYRLGNLVEFDSAPCRCGKSSRRARVLGRPREVVRVGNAAPFFPSMVRYALARRPEVSGRYQLTISSQRQMDVLAFEVQLLPGSKPTSSAGLAVALRDELSSALGLEPAIERGAVDIAVTLRPSHQLDDSFGIKIDDAIVDLRTDVASA